MLMCDVNVLVYAHREDSPNHSRYRQWLEDQINSDASFAVSELVLSGFLRIVTHPKIFDPPSAREDALEFVGAIRSQANCVVVSPQARHWDIFLKLCQVANAKGNLIPDAYHAALAIEAGCEWITTDRGFSRYPGLRWRTP
ncbi:MAG: VapC toxin family PIN domain ribonuclease [Hydrogenophilales bacterium CG17_big_fil_post_rev_8_21_14_2_50_63_12]|nr:MAG: VapC toxin family PIN domain ribonuclease [Hydrogenophilales bacterium CG17_big_fil_post_rev_8_21_14_2_50_63_12]PIX96028.1 MAG: VapC toxin family PIN domain ribonuclease [Hydrogenophilales bacterium CG_4_10_14_3_um_filter_63_21]